MNVAQVVKSTQEQAAAAWISFLNQLRLNELLAKLANQDINLEQALAELQNLKLNIMELVISNRGGGKGIHGFLAEAAEAGVGNARNLVQGLKPAYTWINDNGPADLLRNSTEIQQKFVKAGGHFGLESIKEHLEKYPDFVKNGGKYQIPKEFYENLKKILALSEEDAKKASTGIYKQWKWFQSFFADNNVSPDDIEPSLLNYTDVQREKIDETIRHEEKSIRDTDQKIRDKAYEASKPTARQGAQVAAVSAAAEGGMQFCLGVAKKLKAGKKLPEFTADDWREVGIDTAKGTAQGAIRGASVYAMTNFTATPAAVANALVTAAFGVAAQAYQLQNGSISEEDFIVNSEVLCLDVSISAVSSILGQTMIPIPVLGAVIGNVVGMFLYGIVKDNFSSREQALADRFRGDIEELNKCLDMRYQQLIQHLKEEFAKYTSVLELAFDPDVNTAFDGSIQLADYVGVASENVLRSKQDIDNFFLN